MKRFTDLIRESLPRVRELFPWDLVERMQANPDLLLLDIREPYEFDAMRIAGSLCVPRGILETACEWDYEETVPELVNARDREVVVICRSGNRSVLAADVMQQIGYTNVVSLKTGIRGWNDFEQPLVDQQGQEVDIEDADAYLAVSVRDDQRAPKDV